MASAAVILSSDGDHHLLGWDRVVVQIWTGTPHVTSVAAANRGSREFVAARRERCSLLMIIEPQSPIPDTAARRELSVFTRDVVSTMAIGVAVAEGGGFRASIVRSVGTALTTLAPQKMPLHIVGSVASAAALIGPHLSPTSGGATAMLRALADVRARLGGPR